MIWPVGLYDLFDAGSFAGSFNLTLPAGYLGGYDSSTGVLQIWAVPEPGTIALLLGAAMARWMWGLGRHRSGSSELGDRPQKTGQ